MESEDWVFGALAIVAVVLSFAAIFIAYDQEAVDLTGIDDRINVANAKIDSNKDIITSLKTSLSNELADIKGDINVLQSLYSDWDKDDLEDLEDDIDNNRDDIRDILKCADMSNNETEFIKCLKDI